MNSRRGVRTIRVVLPVGGGEQEVRLDATTGRLRAVTAVSDRGPFVPNDAFLEIGIKQHGITEQHIIIVIVDGTLSPFGTLSWHGDIPLTDGCIIYMRGGSSVERGVTLRAWIEQKAE